MLTVFSRTLLIAALAIAASCSLPAQSTPPNGAASSPMKTTLAVPIYVAGFQVRTSNAKEMSGNGEIGKLWMRFFQQNLAEQMPNRIGQTLMVVYSGYASDEKGEYDYLLGAPVTSADGIPATLTVRQIPAGQYAVITTAQGPAAEVVPSAWKHIWAMSPSELGGQRTFLIDYEIYDQRSAAPTNAQVEIHVGLRR
ncbi:GyrI-like domain-containing protein [Acidicapsa acidisoli]|uniref:GyrI-like domain-containing protein n=1 Tax=Acidicapsa acidisoli TaxID=1615681 RepID=UPI0021E037F0|nr:GyrI-like domain-containing protein [Acidicapsa acidisoli]